MPDAPVRNAEHPTPRRWRPCGPQFLCPHVPSTTSSYARPTEGTDSISAPTSTSLFRTRSWPPFVENHTLRWLEEIPDLVQRTDVRTTISRAGELYGFYSAS